MALEQVNYKRLLVENDGNVATIRMNRPEKLNAIDQSLHDDLHRVFEDVHNDAATDVVVLTGAGRGFCTGGDVSGMNSPTGSGIKRDWDLIHPDRSILDDMLKCDKIIISMVNGPAVGLGATIALFSDFCIMAEEATIADTHVTVGLVAGDGCATIMPLLIGPMRAKELLVLGKFVSGREAADLGLVNRAVPLAMLNEYTMELAHKVAQQPSFAARATKAAVNRYVNLIKEHVQDAAFAWERLSMTHPSHHEAVQRFAARKKTPTAGVGDGPRDSR
jgi:enoyl-CoA hydratase